MLATQANPIFTECRQCGCVTPPQRWPKMFCSNCDRSLQQAQLMWLSKTADPLLDELEQLEHLEIEL